MERPNISVQKGTKRPHIKKRKVSDIPVFIDETVQRPGGNCSKSQLELQNKPRAIPHKRPGTSISADPYGLRCSEALRLKKLQFREYKNSILLMNVETLKHGNRRPKIVLPKKGNLAPFTQHFREWLELIPKSECYVFPSGTFHGFSWDRHLTYKRSHQIVKTTTGKFPHWFRSVCETIYGRLVFEKDAWKLKGFMRLKTLEDTSPYVGGSWEEDGEKIYKL